MIASLVAAVVCLTNEFGTVDVDTFGANVLSYVPAGGREVFFRQPEERRANQWYHGGVPVCWPWFGRNGDPGSVLHGFAWSREWTVDSVENGKGLSRAVLRLERKDEFRLTYEVRLDRELSLRLSMQNLGREKFVVTTGLHPYFAVSNPRNVTVDTPRGPIRCREAMDGGRPFASGTYRVHDSGWSRTFDLTTFGNNKLVIWSADPAESLSGLTPADLAKYICVEPAVLPRCDGFYLQPGQAYDIGMSCRVADSAETEIALPGEPCREPAIGCAPFPDRMSAYVWRNWFVVPHARLADAVGATEADLEEVAAQMGLPKKVDVLPEWRRKGYITVLRRNWHLLDYPQLLKVVDMTREELRFSLMEDDFLFVKLGSMKPKCGALRWRAGMREEGRGKRESIAKILEEEGVDDFTEEPRFTFVKDLSASEQSNIRTFEHSNNSPFDFRLIFSYFADYCDPLWDDEVGSYPEGLLQRLSAQGVNAVWLHTVLRTLAKDPKYPEFGEGSERRIANLNKLVKRCAKYGIRVYLYMNEPRGMPDDFFRGHPEREAFRGCDTKEWPVFAMCTSCPEVRRWVRDSLEQVFRGAPGLGGIFTITMSENLTNCASRGNKKGCPRCKDRDSSEIVAEINAAMIEGMHAGNPDAEALLYDWQWKATDGGREKVMALLPKRNVRILSVSESQMPVTRGGVSVKVSDYSISAVGPGETAKTTWRIAKRNGMSTAAKVQANCSWEMAAFPYLPVIDLVAEHAFNLVHAGVDGVLLSWSHGCCPAPNLSVFRDIRRTDRSKDEVLDRIATDIYGAEAVPAVRRAWTTFADGYREFPFSCSVMYNGPMHMGPANPLHLEPTGYRATMVGIPYDDIRSWCSEYPEKVWADQMAKVRDGFERGCGLFAQAIPLMPADKRAAAEKELRLFRAATLHFRSCVDQVGFYLAREAKDVASMKSIAARELATAKELLKLVRGDSSFGFESSNQYFYIPQDIREKILTCRLW